MDMQIDAKTLEAVTDVLSGVALSVGAPGSVVVPAVAMAKLAARLSDAGVEIPDNADLVALQASIHNQAELPGGEA